MTVERIYLIGALKNDTIPGLAVRLADEGHAVFADWHAPGPQADEFWQAYEGQRGATYREAIYGPHALHVFDFDKHYLDECTVGVLVMPAGKSAHLELGYLAGTGKRTFVLFDGEPARYDLMYLFAEYVCFTVAELVQAIARPPTVNRDWRIAKGFR
jgi:hypothetical protein